MTRHTYIPRLPTLQNIDPDTFDMKDYKLNSIWSKGININGHPYMEASTSTALRNILGEWKIRVAPQKMRRDAVHIKIWGVIKLAPRNHIESETRESDMDTMFDTMNSMVVKLKQKYTKQQGSAEEENFRKLQKLLS